MDAVTSEAVPAMVVAGQRNLLNVPYAPQIGKNADRHFNDCGAACAAMLIAAYTGEVNTVDALYTECAAFGDQDLTAIQLAKVLSNHGVATEWRAFLDEGDLYKILSAKKPCIAVILYAPLRDAGFSEDKKFGGFHYLVVVGIDTASVIFNDPLYTSQAGFQVVVPLAVFMKAWRDAGKDPKLNAACGAIIPRSPLIDRAPVQPPSPQSGTKFRIKADATPDVNVRAGPGTGFSIVRKVFPGDELLVESINAGWAKLVGVNQFVFADFIEKV